MDRFSHHAGVCSAGGERTLRHNVLRDALAGWMDRAGMQPERERPGLLLPQRPEDTQIATRRPADIYVPSFMGSAIAFDLAVTAPQRQHTLAEAAKASLAAATTYADVKAGHLGIADACRAQGVRFVPLVAETTGAWEPTAARALLHVAQAVASREGGEVVAVHGQLLQHLCVLARGHRARAALRRRVELASAAAEAGV